MPHGHPGELERAGLHSVQAARDRSALACAMRRLLALGLLLPAGACTHDFLLDAAPAADARTVIYFAYDGQHIVEARLVQPAASRLVELKGTPTAALEVIAVAYAESIEQLGLIEGPLVPDPLGSQLPEPDGVFQINSRAGIWEKLAGVPTFVREFRVAASSRVGCESRLIRHLDAPQKEPARISYVTIGFSTSPATAVIYFPEVKAVVFRPDFSRVELPIPPDAPRYVATTGTIAIGIRANGCVAKVAVEEGNLSSRPWICAPYPRGIALGEQGDFALVYEREIVIYDRFARETSRYIKEPLDLGLSALVNGETMFFSAGGALDDSATVAVFSPSHSGVEATNAHGEFVTTLTSIRGRVLAGGSAGSAFERRNGSWVDLGKSGIGGGLDIVATPRGFLATGGSGEAAEYIDDIGWCPVTQLTNDAIDVTLRLGSGYLFYSRGTVRPKPSLTWADFGL